MSKERQFYKEREAQMIRWQNTTEQDLIAITAVSELLLKCWMLINIKKVAAH
jgi:hypothetical protein